MNALEEFDASGELFLREALYNSQMDIVFDVGSNVGEWAEHIGCVVGREVHCFEPVPATFQRLRRSAGDQCVVNNLGLSSKTGWEQVRFHEVNDKLTTPALMINNGGESRVMDILCVRGDEYCASREIDHINYLKIDTEGNEFNVLKGFKNMIDERRIDIIQFEYGYANIIMRALLIDFYEMLSSNYYIGKLTPDGVNFKQYGLLDEDFKGPNFVAVLQDRVDLISALQSST